MHAIRWGYILPRLLALVLIVLGAEIATGVLVRRAVISLGQRVAGARVEVGRSRTSLLQTQVVLDGIQVANRRAPLSNLIEADRLELDLDTSALLRRKAVINEATMRGVRFDTPRETSGALPETDTAQPSLSWNFGEVAATVERWLDDLARTLEQDVAQQFESVRLADQLAKRWPAELGHLEEQVQAVAARAKELEASVKLAQENPLRHADVLERLPRETKALDKSISELITQIESLPEQIKADREAVLQARQHDELMVRERLHVDQLESAALTAYLLQEHFRGPVAELVGVVRWSHEMASSALSEPEPERRRGTDVVFAGCRKTPDLLVRSLRFEGSARLGGRPVELQGTLSHLTSQPTLVDEPMRLEFSSTTGLPFDVTATFDRTGAHARDELVVECRDVALSEMRLGSRSTLCVSLPPSRGLIRAHVLIVDNELSGEVLLVQKAVRPSVVVGPELRTGNLDAALIRALNQLDTIETELALAGTLDDPRLELRSNLAPALGTALATAIDTVVRTKVNEILAESQRHMDEQLSNVDRMAEEQTSDLVEQLRGPSHRAAQMAKTFATSKGLSFEELGRRLPANSLFR